MSNGGWAMIEEGWANEHQLLDEGWTWAMMDEQSSINSHLLSPPLPVHPPGWAPLLRSNQTSRNAFLVFGDTFTNSQCWNSDLFSLFLLLFSTLESPCCWLHLRLRRSGSVVDKRTVILPGLNSTQLNASSRTSAPSMLTLQIKLTNPNVEQLGSKGFRSLAHIF